MTYDIYKEVERLKNKHGKDRSLLVRIPSYKSEQVLPPLSNDMGGGIAPKRKENKSPPHLIVDILHKQGPMVLSREELKYSGGKKV
jgi:hypothetical protein